MAVVSLAIPIQHSRAVISPIDGRITNEESRLSMKPRSIFRHQGALMWQALTACASSHAAAYFM